MLPPGTGLGPAHHLLVLASWDQPDHKRPGNTKASASFLDLHIGAPGMPQVATWVSHGYHHQLLLPPQPHPTPTRLCSPASPRPTPTWQPPFLHEGCGVRTNNLCVHIFLSVNADVCTYISSLPPTLPPSFNPPSGFPAGTLWPPVSLHLQKSTLGPAALLWLAFLRAPEKVFQPKPGALRPSDRGVLARCSPPPYL